MRDWKDILADLICELSQMRDPEDFRKRAEELADNLVQMAQQMARELGGK